MPPKSRAQRGEAVLQMRRYWHAVQDVCHATSARVVDFDAKVVRLLDALHGAGKTDAALNHVKAQLVDLPRERVSHWNVYVYTLLKKFDHEVYTSMRDKRWPQRQPRSESGASDEKASTLFEEMKLNPEATEFVPGTPWVPRPDAPVQRGQKPIVHPAGGHHVSISFGGQPLGWDPYAYGWQLPVYGDPTYAVADNPEQANEEPPDTPQPEPEMDTPEQPQACYQAIVDETVAQVPTPQKKEAVVEEEHAESAVADDTEKLTQTTCTDTSVEAVPAEDHSADRAGKDGRILEQTLGVAIVFQVDCPTEMGESVAVIGASPELGQWDASKAVPLSTSSDTYPVWRSEPVVVPVQEEAVEYKFVVKSQCGSHVRWEQLAHNRRVSLSDFKEPGVARFGYV